MKRAVIAISIAIAAGLLAVTRERPNATASDAAASTSLARRAAGARKLHWRDLVPEKNFDDPFDVLTQSQFIDIANIDLVRQLEAQNHTPTRTSIRLAKEGLQRLTTAGIDVDGLLARKDEISRKYDAWGRSVRSDLDGRVASIGGYMLPLEYAGTKVTEFLLVPYLGACIHTPPPPPNQIVYVQIARGIKTKGLYEPVLVTGVLSTQASSQDLSYVDGSAKVDASYRLEARRVKPFQP